MKNLVAILAMVMLAVSFFGCNYEEELLTIKRENQAYHMQMLNRPYYALHPRSIQPDVEPPKPAPTTQPATKEDPKLQRKISKIEEDLGGQKALLEAALGEIESLKSATSTTQPAAPENAKLKKQLAKLQTEIAEHKSLIEGLLGEIASLKPLQVPDQPQPPPPAQSPLATQPAPATQPEKEPATQPADPQSKIIESNPGAAITLDLRAKEPDEIIEVKPVTGLDGKTTWETRRIQTKRPASQPATQPAKP